MSRTEWLSENGAHRSARDRTLLDRASRTLENNIIRPSRGEKPLPWAPFRGIAPSPGTYRGVWNWDAAFHAAAVARWDPQLAREQFRLFFRYQCDGGLFPDVIRATGEVVSAFSKPPVFPWACVRVDRLCPDDDFLREAYAAFVKNERFWRGDRFTEEEGLFHYGAATRGADRLRHVKYESGWDTSVRWDGGIEELWPIDLNCYMVLFYRALQYMAGRLGLPGEAQWRSRERALADRIHTALYDGECYYDVNRLTKRPTGVLSPASLMPLYLGIAPRAEADRTVACIRRPGKLYPGMPTVSYDHPAYSSGDYWRGPTWLNAAYFALAGIQRYGYDALAGEMRERILDWCAAEQESIFEYYDSVSGKGLGARDFGWSAAFIIELILGFPDKEGSGGAAR